MIGNGSLEKDMSDGVTQRNYREGSFDTLSEINYFDENIVYDVMMATLTNFNTLILIHLYLTRVTY